MTVELTATRKQTLSLLRSKVCHFAYQLCKYTGMSSREAMVYAWDYCKAHPEAALITFTKSSGEETTRIVELNWSRYNTVKGTGRPLKEGQRLFVDLVKREAGLPSTISTYQDRIIRIA